MKTFLVEPLSSVAHIEVGEVFRLESNKKLYLLIHRDAVKCIARPWTRWDKLKIRFVIVFLKALLKFKGGK